MKRFLIAPLLLSVPAFGQTPGLQQTLDSEYAQMSRQLAGLVNQVAADDAAKTLFQKRIAELQQLVDALTKERDALRAQAADITKDKN